MNRRLHRSGFTLMEMLLAMAMMSLLAVSLYGALRLSLRARDTALAAIGPARSAQVAMDILRQDIESVMPPGGQLSGVFLGQYGSEVANTSYLEFHCIGGNSLPYAQSTAAVGGRPRMTDNAAPTFAEGIRRVELLVRLLDDGTQALVRRTTYNLLSPVVPVPEEEVLCRGVRAFLIEYFDSTTQEWLDIWDSSSSTTTLPMAVRVSMEIEQPRAADRAVALPAPGEANQNLFRTSRVFFLACYQPTATEGGAQ